MDVNNLAGQNNQINPFSDNPINWRKYFFLFLTNWYWFLITIFITISVAYLKNRYTITNYEAIATLLLEDEENVNDIISEIRSVKKSRRKTEMANEIAKLNSFSLHYRTIDSLNWLDFWTAHGRIARKKPLYKKPPFKIEIDNSSSIWYYDRTFFIDPLDNTYFKFTDKNGIDTVLSISKWHNINDWKFRIINTDHEIGYASYSFTVFHKNSLASRYRAKLSYESDEQSGTVITIKSQGPQADREIEYINTFCENYIFSSLERSNQIAENTIKFLDEQLSIIQDSLDNSENQLLNYRLNNNVINLSREGQIAFDKLYRFYEQKTQLTLKNNYYKYLKEYIKTNTDPQSVIAPTLVDASDRMLIEQVSKLQELYDEREVLLFSIDKNNPGYVRINSQIQNSRNTILEIIDGLIFNNQIARNQIENEEKIIEGKLLQLPRNEQELLNIQRKFEVNNHFYTFLLEKSAEAGIQKASTISNIRILDEASIYTTQMIGAKSSLVYLIMILLGLLIPAGVIFMYDQLDARIKDRTDIEEKLDVPILGAISHEISDVDIPVYTKPRSSFAESFRHVRTNLQYLLRNEDQKKILVTSTISGEGKTFIAMNLAAIIAMNNKKVLLMELDLRRPSLHKIFNLDNTHGISTYIIKEDSLENIIQPSNVEGLDIILAGPVPPNPAELIESNEVKELFQIVSKSYDYIIIDTPPIALVTDAIILCRYSDSNIFVIRQNYSHKGVLELIHKLKTEKDINLSLLVNDIRESRVFGYRYYYGYSYGYGYNYQYRYGYKYYHDET